MGNGETHSILHFYNYIFVPQNEMRHHITYINIGSREPALMISPVELYHTVGKWNGARRSRLLQ